MTLIFFNAVIDFDAGKNNVAFIIFLDKDFVKTNYYMFLERIIIRNRAPFSDLDLSFEDKHIYVLSAVNGKGKTSLLSYIMDAWVEITKKLFPFSYKGHETSYYRINSSRYCMQSGDFSFVYIRFKVGSQSVDYIDYNNKPDVHLYSSSIAILDSIPYKELSADNGKVVRIINEESVTSDFNESVSIYFPAYRYESPAYLNSVYETKDPTIELKSAYSNFLRNPLEVVSGIDGIASWIMDLVLDMKNSPTGETVLWTNVNEVLRKTLISKGYKGHVRFGIGNRNSHRERIAIVEDVVENGTKSIKDLMPSIFDLSSGELALLTIFVEILRQGDNNQANIGLGQIKGLVLIDEIDKHLHIRLQKDILPQLLKLFPNVQFVVSSHSPFLTMGLADEVLDRSHILDFDNKGLESQPSKTAIYQEVYDMMISDNNNFAKAYHSLLDEVNRASKTLIITEGKTDIIYLKKALEKLGRELDVEFCSFNGDKDAEGLAKSLARVKLPYRVIAIFDRDNDKIKDLDGKYEQLGGNVYAFKISIPQFRKDANQDKISIEYYFTDDEVHTKLSDGRQLFFGRDFSDLTGRCKFDHQLILTQQKDRGKDKIVESLEGLKVVGEDESFNYLSTKNEFAEAISNNIIEISQNSWKNFDLIFDIIQEINNIPSVALNIS